ncbi:hypothetical protein FBU30_004559 [Linnemannia zychae]|nr:hypothetical protein FBU30_004559 [Linnemannia zychae]
MAFVSKQKKESNPNTISSTSLAPDSIVPPSSTFSSTSPFATSTTTATAVATSTNTGAAFTLRSNLLHRPIHPPPQLEKVSATHSSSVALNIPEIVLAIAEFLDRSTLAQCSQVCKEWCKIFQSLLYRIVTTADFDQPDFYASFLNHARFATSIEWFQESSLTGAGSVFKKQAWHQIFKKKPAPLRSLAPPMKSIEQLQNIFQTDESTPALETLSIRIHKLDPNIVLALHAPSVTCLQIGTRGYPAKKPKVFMDTILQSFPNLVHLTLEGLFTLCSQASYAVGNESMTSSASLSQSQAQQEAHAQPPPVPLVHQHTTTIAGMTISGPFPVSPDLVENPPALTFNTPQIHHSSFSNSTSSYPLSTAVSRNNSTLADSTNTNNSKSSLKSLSLRLVDISQKSLLALAKQAPNLESLLIEEFLVPDMMIKIYRWTWSKEFIRSLRISFPRLTSIRMAFPFDSIKEDTIIEILKSFPLLTTVGFRNSFFGTRALEVMQEHCKFVECLDVSFGNSRGFKGALVQFLQTWPRLREFEADGFVFSLDTPVDDDVPRSPWACTRLEKLVCGFSGTDSMIFQHLAQLPHLTSLTISYPSMNIWPIESTLAWMSKSTKLEYFWFPQTRHVPVEKGSIMWILDHWPRLQTLHIAGGLVSQKDTVQGWCRDAGRPNLVVEFDRV